MKGLCYRDSSACRIDRSQLRAARRCRRSAHYRCRHARQGLGRKGIPRQASLLSLRWTQFPDAAAFRRHPPSHLVLVRRGRLRRSAWPERMPTVSPKAKRSWPRPASRPSCRDRSIFSLSPTTPTIWVSSRTSSPASPAMLCRSDRPPLVRHDPVGPGRRCSDRDHCRLLPRHIPGRPSPPFQARRPIESLGGRRSRRRKRPTIQAASPPSSATSGRRIPAATTFTAMSSSATIGDRASRVEPFTVVQPLGSDNPRDLWKWMEAYEEQDRGQACLPSPITAIFPTGACSR